MGGFNSRLVTSLKKDKLFIIQIWKIFNNCGSKRCSSILLAFRLKSHQLSHTWVQSIFTIDQKMFGLRLPVRQLANLVIKPSKYYFITCLHTSLHSIHVRLVFLCREEQVGLRHSACPCQTALSAITAASLYCVFHSFY